MIEKVHGIHATTITLNDRFTILAESPPPRVLRPKRRSVSQSKGHNIRNQNLIEQIADYLQEANRQSVKQRLGLRRYGSESSLSGLRRVNSTGNLSQTGFKNRISWRQSNGNLNRSPSVNNLAGVWNGRGFRRRGARMGLTRGRMRGRGGRQQMGRLRPRAQTQRGRGRGRGTARRGRGRGGNTNAKKAIPTKEELDLQLDQYMASTKSALDRELDAYMKNAMELE